MSNQKYQCPRCKHSFPKKYNLDKHLKRKNPCRSIVIDLNKKIQLNKKSRSLSNDNLPKELIIVDNFDSTLEDDDHYQIVFEDDENDQDDQDDQDDENDQDDQDDQDVTSIGSTNCEMKSRQSENLIREYDSQLKEKKKMVNHFQLNQNNELLKVIDQLKIEFQQQLEELKQQPRIVEQHNQNILQVVCIGNNDNYLDMLTEQWGFDRALGFIKDCALSQISGDCKLLEKIYFSNCTGEAPIKYLDKNRQKIEFIDEKRQKILDIRGTQLCRRLANNLQNSYLKGVNYLINENLRSKACPNKFLEEYDLQSWNAHIYNLSDPRYQKKILSQLEIPISK
jgi:hypothetical protein